MSRAVALEAQLVYQKMFTGEPIEEVVPTFCKNVDELDWVIV